MPSSYREHGYVVEAILAGQADAAADAMRTHVSAGGKAIADLVLLACAAEAEVELTVQHDG